VRYYLQSTVHAKRFVGILRGSSRNLHELRHMQVAVALVFGVDPPAAPPDANLAFLLEVLEHPKRGPYASLTLRFALEVGVEWHRNRVASPSGRLFGNRGVYHMQLMRHNHRMEEGARWSRSTVLDFELMVARGGSAAADRAVAAIEAAAAEARSTTTEPPP
jgi:hypothetical protein